MKLRELGEFGLIERIRQRSADGPGVVRGIGDDTAVLELPAGHQLLTSTDLLIEEIHFRLDWTDLYDLGRKAVAVNLSDIAAMGGTPRFLYLGLACPSNTEVADLEALLEGVLAETAQYGVTLTGGDTCRSPGPWMLAVTVEGSAPAGRAVTRQGARPGDLVMVSGTLGDSALALRLLQEGLTPDPALLERHHRPTPRIELGRLLAEAGLASAMIDISDGLAADLEHILQASSVDAVIDSTQLPLSTAFQHHLAGDGDARELALHGGEDYELLFTLAAADLERAQALAAQLGLPLTPVGRVRAGSGNLYRQDGAGPERPILVRGYDHFCPSRGTTAT